MTYAYCGILILNASCVLRVGVISCVWEAKIMLFERKIYSKFLDWKNETKAVSYTHLDVYKRQGRESSRS